MSQLVTTKYSLNTNNNQLITCKVCGDRASGKHYGVPSCDGCRGFFKRSIRRNLEYHCKEGGTCIVDVSRRNQCQACRFSKCLKVNMRREAVQHERAPRSYITQAQIPMGLSTGELYSAKHLPVLTSTTAATTFSSEFLASASITNYSYNTLSGALPFHFDLNIFGNNTNSNNTINYPTTTIPEHKYYSYPHENLGSDDLIKLEIIYEAAAKLLFLSVRWIRSIAEFNQLEINDQKILLQNSWFEIFIVTASQWGLNLDMLLKDKNIQLLQTVVDKYQYLRIDNTEGNCLKALILFNPNYTDLTAVDKVVCVQEQALSLLHSKCGTVRFGHILLFMPNIKVAASNKQIQEILFKGTIGEVAIERILSNLLNNIA